MDWRRTTVADVDQYISRSYYPGLSDVEGINLRVEMNRILYGGLGRLPKGHWIVYRSYDKTSKSSYYNNATKEGVGGPTYSYSDQLLRTRRVPISKRTDQLDALKAGIEISDTYVYYFEYTLTPKLGDDIYELSLADHTTQPSSISSLTFAEKYRIKRMHPYRLENGNVQYWMLVAEYDEITY